MKVIVYGKPACGGCVATKRALEKQGTPYEYVDVTRSDQAQIDYERESDLEAVREERRMNYPLCHCGNSVAWGFDGDQNHTRDMCEHCDSVRCDAYPGACNVTIKENNP